MSGSKIKNRNEISPGDCWDLSALYADAQAWESDLERQVPRMETLGTFKGTLTNGAGNLRSLLDFLTESNIAFDRLGTWAQLKASQDLGDSESQGRLGRFTSLMTKASAIYSFFEPELLGLPQATLDLYLTSPELSPYHWYLKKIIRSKPHILGEEAEKILALGAESAGSLRRTFSALTNTDLDFGTILTQDGEQPLTQSTFAVFLLDKDEKVRAKAYTQFYAQFSAHKNTLANLLAGSVRQDLFNTRARNYSCCLQRALYPDNVPAEVYDNLIAAIREHLPLLHRYYALKKKVLGVEKLHHWDVYAPLTGDTEVKHTYDQASSVILEALKPLGEEYVQVLGQGLKSGWVDRYENKGKRSGAFSSGCYGSYPYILMNFKENNLRDVFTLAHEAGHSMHSWYSQNNNPYQDYSYTIFEAEVASTFNEQLLAHHMLAQTKDRSLKAGLLGKILDDMVATIFRQTMFAQFEKEIHSLAEDGGDLTLDSIRTLYRRLQEDYFGPEVILPEVADLECLRIPHFYNAFYVYKYATGLSAAIALSKRVLEKFPSATQDYLSFLKSGGSRYPLESLKLAGVDMSGPEPVRQAMEVFKTQLEVLEKLLA